MGETADFQKGKFLQASQCASAGRENDPVVFVTAHVTAPVLFSYVWWVLQTAREKGINRLYFLARDGYYLYRCAEKICGAFGWKIENRYLYSSRMAWRFPSYHFIGDEAYTLIFQGGYRVTPETVLARLKLTEQEQHMLLQEAGFTQILKKSPMSVAMYHDFSEKLWNTPAFQKILQEKSQEAYLPAMGYLKQEGLMDETPFALVDTGWTGSMQRTLRQLLESGGARQKLTGFYFGMYERPKSKEDGDYLTWCFSRDSGPVSRAMFNNNLVECMCICPHSMTVGYFFNGVDYLPLFKDSGDTGLPSAAFQKRLDVLDCFVEHVLNHCDPNAFTGEQLWGTGQKALRRLMCRPSCKEASVFQEHYFCDDVAESYFTPLVKPAQKEEFRKYVLLRRLWKKVISRNSGEAADLFWPYGSLAVSNVRFKGWYRFNMLLWDILRQMQ